MAAQIICRSEDGKLRAALSAVKPLPKDLHKEYRRLQSDGWGARQTSGYPILELVDVVSGQVHKVPAAAATKDKAQPTK